jgi:transcriptional regulator with XRE-family HTH domain
MNIKDRVAIRIRTLREGKKLTQEQLAWKSEVDRTFMNQVENGRRNISIETLEKILNGLDVGLRDFFADDSFQIIKAERK